MFLPRYSMTFVGSCSGTSGREHALGYGYCFRQPPLDWLTRRTSQNLCSRSFSRRFHAGEAAASRCARSHSRQTRDLLDSQPPAYLYKMFIIQARQAIFTRLSQTPFAC